MAKQPGLDFQSAKGGFGELKRRLLFVIGALIVFRIGSFIPIPGIDATVLAKLLEQQRGTIIEMFNMFSGGALSRGFYLCPGYYAVYFGLYYYPAADGGSSSVSRNQERRGGWPS